MSEATVVANEKKSKLAKLVSKAMEREIPLLTPEQQEQYDKDFCNMRSAFAAWCVSNQQYYTLALLSTCEISLKPELPAPAALYVDKTRLEVAFHPLAIELFHENPQAAFFLFVHELRHIVQVCQLRDIEDLLDLTPIRDVYFNKMTAAKKQEHKDAWQKMIDEIENKDSAQWKRRKYEIANITMDVALHQDVLKLLPNVSPQLNTFLRDRFSPYMSGFSFETIAKDMIASGTAKEHLEKVMLSAGPKLKQEINAALAENHNQINVSFLCHVLRSGISIQTMDTLTDQFNGQEGFEHGMEGDQEWLQIADEYVRFLASKVEELPPDSPPQSGGGDGEGGGDLIDQIMEKLGQLDEHGFGGGGDGQDAGSAEEIERIVRDAVRRAQEKGQVMAHQAGVGIGDQDMLGDSSTSLNSRIKQAMEKIRIRFIKIFQETNSKKYVFDRINRIYSELSYLPGHRKDTKPMPQVVLVLDTSGSMWSQHYVNQMLAMARKLHKENKLASLYFCDTQLHWVDFNSKRTDMNVVGGGGTELSVPICEEIQEREKFKDGWELVYATDEFCPGLKQAKRDKRWVIHVINVPRMLDEDI